MVPARVRGQENPILEESGSVVLRRARSGRSVLASPLNYAALDSRVTIPQDESMLTMHTWASGEARPYPADRRFSRRRRPTCIPSALGGRLPDFANYVVGQLRGRQPGARKRVERPVPTTGFVQRDEYSGPSGGGIRNSLSGEHFKLPCRLRHFHSAVPEEFRRRALLKSLTYYRIQLSRASDAGCSIDSGSLSTTAICTIGPA